MARPKLFIALLSFICLLSIGGQLARAAPDSLYTIEDIKVDVTADNAAAAREKAFHQAQTAAFEALITQLLSPEELSAFERPDSAVIASLIKDFEVTQERLSSVRHIGIYTVRFKESEVRALLNRAGVSYTDVGRKPMLVLPYYQKGPNFILLEDNNPWLAAWREHKSFRGLTPVTVPIGDLEDVKDLPASEPMSYDRDKLERLAARYGAGGVLIVLALPAEKTARSAMPESLDVAIYTTDAPRPILVQRFTVQSGEDETVFRKAVLRAHKLMEQDWKSQTLAESNEGNRLKARVRFSRMEQWVETQRKLESVSGVTDIHLLSLKPGMAEIEMEFLGTERRLRLALDQADVTLTTPRVSFGAQGLGQFGRSPLIYDLYLNKYKPGAQRDRRL